MNDKRDTDGVRMLREDEVHVARPPLWLLLAESRVGAEFVAYLLSQPWLGRLPRGDGQPVLVVPGFGATDTSTLPLRRVLRRLGYAAHGWELGRNLGMRAPVKHALGRSL
ncbi:MAG TPA: hypothetical protein VNJ47_01325, partial [Nevskiales bacterium]|nr:hypothetical protein [Nevskiales bacterium]